MTAEKSRSEAASEMTKAVVAWVRSLGQRRRATTVRRLPGMEKGGENAYMFCHLTKPTW